MTVNRSQGLSLFLFQLHIPRMASTKVITPWLRLDGTVGYELLLNSSRTFVNATRLFNTSCADIWWLELVRRLKVCRRVPIGRVVYGCVSPGCHYVKDTNDNSVTKMSSGWNTIDSDAVCVNSYKETPVDGY